MRDILIHNSLTGKKHKLETVEVGKIRFYSCGPTTYDFLHIGNARAIITSDLLYRVLSHFHYEVNYVRNFTDVDDKIIQRANELGVNPEAHALRFLNECLHDMGELRLKTPTHMPRVTQTIPEIIQMIELLIEKGAAYCVDGEVLYHVPSNSNYGRLSKKDLESLQHGIRVEVAAHKKHPSDFVLWKPARPQDPSWDSPWGKGRPGWHIECSAMAKKFLGEQIDLHHGGVDLIFPHHENEMAQSESASGGKFCEHWAHNAFLNFGTDKMSKSLGNVITMRSFIEKFGGLVLRHIFISSHYRTTMEWSEQVIERAINDLERIHEFAKEFLGMKLTGGQAVSDVPEDQDKVLQLIESTREKMDEALANDFNTALAFSEFFKFIRTMRRDSIFEKIASWSNGEKAKRAQESCRQLMNIVSEVLGVLDWNAEKTLKNLDLAKKGLKQKSVEASGEEKESAEKVQASAALSDSEIEQLIQDRKKAKEEKNWTEADRIRKIFEGHGIALIDHPTGLTSWKWK